MQCIEIEEMSRMLLDGPRTLDFHREDLRRKSPDHLFQPRRGSAQALEDAREHAGGIREIECPFKPLRLLFHTLSTLIVFVGWPSNSGIPAIMTIISPRSM